MSWGRSKLTRTTPKSRRHGADFVVVAVVVAMVVVVVVVVVFVVVAVVDDVFVVDVEVDGVFVVDDVAAAGVFYSYEISLGKPVHKRTF